MGVVGIITGALGAMGSIINGIESEKTAKANADAIAKAKAEADRERKRQEEAAKHAYEKEQRMNELKREAAQEEIEAQKRQNQYLGSLITDNFDYDITNGFKNNNDFYIPSANIGTKRKLGRFI